MKENFDDILRRKWAQKQFPVDDHHRAQMLELLDKKDRKRMFPFWWFGSLVIVTGLSAYFFFQQPQAGNTGISSASGDHSSVATEGQADPQIANKIDPLYEQQDPSFKDIPTEANTVESLNTVSTNKTNSDPVLKSTEVQPAFPHAATSHPNVKTSSYPGQTSAPSAKGNKILPAGQPSKHAIDPKTGLPDQASTATEKAVQPATLASENVVTPPAYAAEPSEVVQSTNIEQSIMPVETKVNRSTTVTDPLFVLPVSALPYQSSPAPVSSVPEVKPDRYLSIFGEAGTGLILASQPDFSAGWKLRVGAGLAYTIQPRLQLNGSLGYLYQSGGFDFQRSSTVQQASFGARSSFNTLTPDRLHYVYSRIGGLYRFKRHFISMHGGVQYLYGAQGEIVTQTVDQFSPGVTSNTSYSWLVTDGLQRWQWNADIAYGFQMTPKLSLSVGTDIFFSALTRKDEALSQEGYYWEGMYAPVHPFITLNYQIYAIR